MNKIRGGLRDLSQVGTLMPPSLQATQHCSFTQMDAGSPTYFHQALDAGTSGERRSAEIFATEGDDVEVLPMNRSAAPGAALTVR